MNRNTKPFRRSKRVFFLLLGLIAFFLLGDLTYSSFVAFRLERWERSIVRGEDGVREGCRAFSIGSGDTAFLMVHGFADSPALYRNMADDLAARGFACRAMLLPGFAMPMEHYAQTDFASWLAAFEEELTMLRARHERVWVIAHSLGAAVVLNRVRVETEGIDGLVLIAPLLEVSNRRSPLLPVTTWYALCDRLLLFTDVVESIFPMNLQSAKRPDYPRERFHPRSVYRALFEALDQLEGRASEIALPTLLIASPLDRVVDYEAAVDFFDKLASPRKELLVLHESGHAIPVDGEWSLATERIARFVLTD